MLGWKNCPAVERSPDKVCGAWAFRFTRVPVILISALLCCALPSAWAKPFEEVYEQLERENNQRNFAGWKGIVFECVFDQEDPTEVALIDRAITDIELLGAANNVKIDALKNKPEKAAYVATVSNRLRLNLSLLSTKPKNNSDIKGVYVFLNYYTYKGAKTDSIDSHERSGELILWSRQLIATGTSTGLTSPVSDQIEGLLKKALTVYMKNNQLSEPSKSP